MSDTEPTPDHRQLSRRHMLLGIGGAAIGGLAVGAGGALGISGLITSLSDGSPTDTAAAGTSGAATDETSPGRGDSTDDAAAGITADVGAPVPATGTHQAGVARPATPQRNAVIAVITAPPAEVLGALAALGERILRLTGEGPDGQGDPLISSLLPDGPGDLSVTVGVGPTVLAASPVSTATAGVLELPLFAGDAELPAAVRGGELLLAVYASNAAALDPVLQSLIELVPGARVAWSEHGFRGPGEGTIVRNPFGFFDGIIVPQGEAELAANVWIASGPLAGGTICVMRRFALDTRAFGALEVAEQDRVIGRERASGAPLSGGTLRDEVNLLAKTDTGEYMVPLDAHVRAAHPSFTGSDLMLRRSYGISTPGSDSVPEAGMVFISFQREVETFIRTQLRLDESDALMRFSRPTATAAFAILPGFTAQRPLGASLAG